MLTKRKALVTLDPDLSSIYPNRKSGQDADLGQELKQAQNGSGMAGCAF